MGNRGRVSGERIFFPVELRPIFLPSIKKGAVSLASSKCLRRKSSNSLTLRSLSGRSHESFYRSELYERRLDQGRKRVRLQLKPPSSDIFGGRFGAYHLANLEKEGRKGTLRMWVDSLAVNKATFRNYYSILLVAHSFDPLARLFTKENRISDRSTGKSGLQRGMNQRRLLSRGGRARGRCGSRRNEWLRKVTSLGGKRTSLLNCVCGASCLAICLVRLNDGTPNGMVFKTSA
ncbi:hypothetical protein KY289_028937 [Solanum tuberosum]|nr:hypothetical protein KY289_028937 [Solanum tuberosum]